MSGSSEPASNNAIPNNNNNNNVIVDKSSTQFDTTKLDISKIMGLNDDLTKTFQMLDSLEDGSSKKKGGKR